MALCRLYIHSAEFYAYHGARDAERLLGGKFQVDAELWYDAQPAIQSDSLRYALNYEQVVECIQRVVHENAYHLLETLAHRILTALLRDFPTVQRARVRVRKLYVPLRYAVEYVEVEQEAERLELRDPQQ
ncbi:MAG: dihydroneopterin aldolase [Candidatus Kapabacteria bacterium]|nr:dihydroneopterin aldolase [Candidatus Kapabacteria bacterium]MDW8011411.1 dihydroneopterin aldolase [Bacteroidota bacterium]